MKISETKNHYYENKILFYMNYRVPKPAILLPVVLFFILKLIMYGYMRHLGYQGYAQSWERWDSGLYLNIVAEGHTLFFCNTSDSSAGWCGNAGWAVGYPFILWILKGITGLSAQALGVWVSNFFLLAYLLLVARIADIQDYRFQNWVYLLLFAVFPGSVYYHAIFPISQVVFFMALLVYGLQRQRFWLAGFAAFSTILSYSAGIFISLPLLGIAIFLFLSHRTLLSRYCTQTIVPALLGIFTYYMYDYIKTGHWDALYMTQKKYGHKLYIFYKIIIGHFKLFFTNLHNYKGIVEFQTLFVTALAFTTITYLFYFLYKLYKAKHDKAIVYQTIEKIFVALFIPAFWFLPLSLGYELSLFRTCALLSIVQIIVLKKENFRLNLLLLCIYIALFVPMLVLFWDKTLV